MLGSSAGHLIFTSAIHYFCQRKNDFWRSPALAPQHRQYPRILSVPPHWRLSSLEHCLHAFQCARCWAVWPQYEPTIHYKVFWVWCWRRVFHNQGKWSLSHGLLVHKVAREGGTNTSRSAWLYGPGAIRCEDAQDNQAVNGSHHAIQKVVETLWLGFLICALSLLGRTSPCNAQPCHHGSPLFSWCPWL